MSVFPSSDDPEQVITVQQDYDSDTPVPTHHLERGESRTFGRGGRNRHVDILVAAGDRAVSRVAGEVTSHGDHWRISNLSPTKAYVVENTERLAGFLQVPPYTQGMLVPFETSRVLVPGAHGEHSFLVMAPAACGSVLVPSGDPLGDSDLGESNAERTDVRSFRIDRLHTYYRVLAAFCEPRLLDPGTRYTPTQHQVARRLKLSKAAVNSHIDYLLKTKFQVEPEDARQGQDWRVDMLTEKALHFGLVTREDLSVLPDPEGDA
ncbi:helix-turn-helix domain-containing protein [Nocardiopsis sp. MG754419]|uniref:MarR family transcriptional regulator n=1 Tax=Nocardiopsis sp. MG754419 TaxID=2259865 RepID=UPI001BAC4CEB|nr:helix-turn-helix domain-containing protein [Nocardiopsis sp. MG754419]MBR8745264.1 winged helix-turn-helix domain-containing protein [Nocardiopsis sp. MG754419]